MLSVPSGSFFSAKQPSALISGLLKQIDSVIATCQIRTISEVLKEEIQIGISSK